MMPRLPGDRPRCAVAMISAVGITRFCSGIRVQGPIIQSQSSLRGALATKQSSLRINALDCFASLAMTDHAAPARIGGWNDSAVSHGKKIQVSCDTSVIKVLTSGRPIGFA